MDRRGQTTVEFALVALLLLTFLFAIIDLAVMFYVNLTVQHAVREGARYAVVGQPPGSSAGLARRAALTQKVLDSANGLCSGGNVVSGPTVSVLTPANTNAFSQYSGRQVPDTGQSNQIIIVRMTYAWPLLTPILQPFFPDGKYTFTASATMKNEQWGWE
jgi:Flp pilus assembly protein TadG